MESFCLPETAGPKYSLDYPIGHVFISATYTAKTSLLATLQLFPHKRSGQIDPLYKAMQKLNSAASKRLKSRRRSLFTVKVRESAFFNTISKRV